MASKSSAYEVVQGIHEHRKALAPDGIPPSFSLSEWIHDIRFELEGIVGACENDKRWHILRAIALGTMCLEEYGVPEATDG